LYLRKPKKIHHGGKEDTETTINAEIAEIAEHALKARFDAAGRQSRPGRKGERIRMQTRREPVWLAF